MSCGTRAIVRRGEALFAPADGIEARLRAAPRQVDALKAERRAA